MGEASWQPGRKRGRTMSTNLLCPKCGRPLALRRTAAGQVVYSCATCQLVYRHRTKPAVRTASQMGMPALPSAASRPEIRTRQSLPESIAPPLGAGWHPVKGLIGGPTATGNFAAPQDEEREEPVHPVIWAFVGAGGLGVLLIAALFLSALWPRASEVSSGGSVPSARAMARIAIPSQSSTLSEVAGLEQERQKLAEVRRQYEELIAAELKRHEEEQERRRQEEEERRRKEEEARAIEEARQRQVLLQQMGSATSRAWRQLQQVEAKIRGTEAPQSEICRLAASQYAQVDLTGVDPDLVQHVQDLVAVYREGIGIWESIEAELRQIEKGYQLAMGFGALMGAAADSENPEGGAAGFGLLTGLLGLPVVADAIQKVEERYKASLEKWSSRLNGLFEREKYLATELSSRYGTTFIDAL
jgi:ribosomal protein L37AE/L43A